MTDQFTKWVKALVTTVQTTETTAIPILNEAIARFNSALSIHTELGSNYESRIFRELCDLLELQKEHNISKKS